MLVKGVLYSGLGEAYRFIVITTFNIRVVATYLSTFTPIGIANKF